MLLEQLKQRTRKHHESLERDLDEQHYFADVISYRRLLQRWYGWYEPWERMAATVAPEEIRMFLHDRWKTPLLQKDLADLQSERTDRLLQAPIEAPATEPQWIGALYVMEGSTLGGQLIARHLEQHLGLGAGHGYSFFRSYGDKVGAKWREFREFAQRCVAEEEVHTAVAAAEQTFVSIHGWLCPNPK